MLIIRHEFGIIFLEINRGAVIRPGTEDIQLEKKKLGGRILFNIILFGFIGQVAWAVENVYFNTFLFNYIGGTADDIAKMVAASAIAAVVTTFIMGTLSDKLDRRKIFISGGYIIWGFTVAVFAFISRENIGKLFNISDTSKVVAATVCVVIIMDCVMTFFGSTSNDAAFNAWVTDVTVPENRGTAEAVLALLPVFATVIVTVAFGVGVEAAGYPACFMFLGALVTICGIIGLFSVKDPRKGVKQSTNYFSDLIYGFRPSVIKNNAALYLCLASACIFNNANVDKMNNIILNICDEGGYYFLDVNEVLSDGNHSLISGASSDGVHMYEEYCKKMLDYLKTHYVSETSSSEAFSESSSETSSETESETSSETETAASN